MFEDFFGSSQVLCTHGQLTGCRECNYCPEFNRLFNAPYDYLIFDLKMFSLNHEWRPSQNVYSNKRD